MIINRMCHATTGLLLAVCLSLVATSCRTTGAGQAMPGAVGEDDSFAKGYELYVQHCAACHGRDGRGDGPAAIALDVRPRDFRQEPFRYVSTLNGVPTHDDLMQTIRSGRHLGAMPSGPHLSDIEGRVLAEYVREINRLGWAERLAREFADDEDMTPEEIEEISLERVTPEDPIPNPYPPTGFRSSTETGRRLYFESCASCHGPTGRGDGLDKPKDEQGRPIAVRDLTTGQFRGGVTPEEVFKRLRCGIPGTPMPAQVGLTDEEIWELVYYVYHLAGRR